jgi:hypothetical protein
MATGDKTPRNSQALNDVHAPTRLGDMDNSERRKSPAEGQKGLTPRYALLGIELHQVNDFSYLRHYLKEGTLERIAKEICTFDWHGTCCLRRCCFNKVVFDHEIRRNDNAIFLDIGPVAMAYAKGLGPSIVQAVETGLREAIVSTLEEAAAQGPNGNEVSDDELYFNAVSRRIREIGAVQPLAEGLKNHLAAYCSYVGRGKTGRP